VEFYLRPKPIVLDSLVVAMTRTRVYRGLQKTGYYDRFQAGFGSFITPEEIEKRNPREVADLFRGVPGIQVRREGITGTRIFLFRPNFRGRETCNPRVYVDGMQRLNDPFTEEGAPGIRLEDLVSISDIAAVEVHTRATSIPLLYGGTQEGCGAILIWTKAYGGG
jgi:outer membrane cobalamin receptor